MSLVGDGVHYFKLNFVETSCSSFHFRPEVHHPRTSPQEGPHSISEIFDVAFQNNWQNFFYILYSSFYSSRALTDAEVGQRQ